MRIFKYLAILAVVAEGQRKKNKNKKKNGKKVRATEATTTTSTASTTTATTFSTVAALSDLEKVISGSFQSSVAGETIQIIVNGSDTLTILKKQGNVISGSETCTASATAAASDTITCSVSGVGQYDNNTGVITFNGVTWSRNGAAEVTAGAANQTGNDANPSAGTGLDCASILGKFTDNSGNVMIITSETNAAANGGGTSGGQTASNRNTVITAVIQNSSGTVIGFDSGTFTSPTVTLSVAGAGTYDGASCMIDWANGMADWVKQEDDLTEATTTTVEPTTKSVTTAGTAAIAADSAASATEQSFVGQFIDETGNGVEITRNPDGTFTAIVRNADGQIIGFENGTFNAADNSVTFSGSLGKATADGAGNVTFVDPATGNTINVSPVTAAATATTAQPGNGGAGAAPASNNPGSGSNNGNGNSNDPYYTGGSNTYQAPAPANPSYNSPAPAPYQAPASPTYNAPASPSYNAPAPAYSGPSLGDMYSGTATNYQSGTGYVKGDPHIKISQPGQGTICYDIEANAYNYVSLIDDEGIGFEINGKIDHVKAGKNRLAAIGIRTNAGVQIKIEEEGVSVGTEDEFDMVHPWTDYSRMNIEDVDIEIVVPFGQSHHNTVMIELDTGAQFRISKKYGKDSMELEVLKDFGLSPIVGGIFGQVIRPKDYALIGSTLMLEDPPRSIEGIEYDEKDNCYRISQYDLPTFLGHQESEYAVEDLFSGIKTSWFNEVTLKFMDFLGMEH